MKSFVRRINTTGYFEDKDHDIIIFEAGNVNDPDWDYVIDFLKSHVDGFEVRWADGNWMNFCFPKKNRKRR